MNPRSPPPVLLNDVVFAVHAFLACFITILQCLFYERDNQSVSSKCIALMIVLISFGFCSAAATVLRKIQLLSFVTSLSYIKMAVTCCKYFPQVCFILSICKQYSSLKLFFIIFKLLVFPKKFSKLDREILRQNYGIRSRYDRFCLTQKVVRLKKYCIVIKNSRKKAGKMMFYRKYVNLNYNFIQSKIFLSNRREIIKKYLTIEN